MYSTNASICTNIWEMNFYLPETQHLTLVSKQKLLVKCIRADISSISVIGDRSIDTISIEQRKDCKIPIININRYAECGINTVATCMTHCQMLHRPISLSSKFRTERRKKYSSTLHKFYWPSDAKIHMNFQRHSNFFGLGSKCDSPISSYTHVRGKNIAHNVWVCLIFLLFLLLSISPRYCMFRIKNQIPGEDHITCANIQTALPIHESHSIFECDWFAVRQFVCIYILNIRIAVCLEWNFKHFVFNIVVCIFFFSLCYVAYYVETAGTSSIPSFPLFVLGHCKACWLFEVES